MKRIFVTGGAGYIGSHCCKALSEAGFEPVVFDNLSTGHRSFCRWGPLIQGDLRDGDAVDRAMAAMRPAAVLHFAAESIVSASVTRPGTTYRTNVAGTLTLLEAMERYGVRNMVFSSTCAIYGQPGQARLTEATAIHPISPYGASKAMVERILDDHDTAYGLRSVRLRYFNAAGADPDGMVGEWHEPETHLVPIVLDVAMGLRPAVPINGDDYDTPDGTAVRDYIHVTDLAEAHVAALRHLLDGGRSVAVNVGTGVGASVAQIINAVEKVTGRRVATTTAKRRQGDPPSLVANPSLASHVLDWRASRELSDLIGDAWRWHQTIPRPAQVLAS